MLAGVSQTITYLADITDPTSDGMGIKIIDYIIAGLALATVACGAWYAFSAFREGKGKSASITGIREVALSVLVVEAVLGGIAILANYGSNILSTLLN